MYSETCPNQSHTEVRQLFTQELSVKWAFEATMPFSNINL